MDQMGTVTEQNGTRFIRVFCSKCESLVAEFETEKRRVYHPVRKTDDPEVEDPRKTKLRELLVRYPLLSGKGARMRLGGRSSDIYRFMRELREEQKTLPDTSELRQKIEAALRENPSLSGRQMQKIVHSSSSEIYRLMREIKGFQYTHNSDTLDFTKAEQGTEQ